MMMTTVRPWNGYYAGLAVFATRDSTYYLKVGPHLLISGMNVLRLFVILPRVLRVVPLLLHFLYKTQLKGLGPIVGVVQNGSYSLLHAQLSYGLNTYNPVYSPLSQYPVDCSDPIHRVISFTLSSFITFITVGRSLYDRNTGKRWWKTKTLKQVHKKVILSRKNFPTPTRGYRDR